MRSLFALLLIAVPAHAFDGQKVAEEYYEVSAACRLGDWYDEKISAAESDKQCERREVLASELQSHGFCWDKSEQVWAVCK